MMSYLGLHTCLTSLNQFCNAILPNLILVITDDEVNIRKLRSKGAVKGSIDIIKT